MSRKVCTVFAIFLGLFLAACSTLTSQVIRDDLRVQKIYTKEVCRADLQRRLDKLLSQKKSVYFYDNGVKYRSIDVKVDFYKGEAKDLVISIRSAPLVYWGFNELTGEQSPGLPKLARAMVDKAKFQPVQTLKCPRESADWDKPLPDGPITVIEDLFDNLMMFWGFSSTSPMQMDFLRAFGLMFVPAQEALARQVQKVSGMSFFCLTDYFDFFSDVNHTHLKVAVATNCQLFDKPRDSRIKAFERMNEEMNEHKYLVVFETDFDINPVVPASTQGEALKKLQAEILAKAAVLAQKTFEAVKERYANIRSS